MEEEKSNKLTQFINDHPRAIFWIRFTLWVICAAGLPFAFIAWRFNIFKNNNALALSGWGIIGIAILAIFVLVLIFYIRQGFKAKSVLITQCINGFCRVIIPLSILFLILFAIRNNIDIFLQALGCVILCELIALPINPFPAWVKKSQKDVREEERKGTIDYLADKIFKRENNKGDE